MITCTKGKDLGLGRNPVKEVPLERHRTDPSENTEADRVGERVLLVLCMVKNTLDTHNQMFPQLCPKCNLD